MLIACSIIAANLGYNSPQVCAMLGDFKKLWGDVAPVLNDALSDTTKALVGDEDDSSAGSGSASNGNSGSSLFPRPNGFPRPEGLVQPAATSVLLATTPSSTSEMATVTRSHKEHAAPLADPAQEAMHAADDGSKVVEQASATRPPHEAAIAGSALKTAGVLAAAERDSVEEARQQAAKAQKDAETWQQRAQRMREKVQTKDQDLEQLRDELRQARGEVERAQAEQQIAAAQSSEHASDRAELQAQIDVARTQEQELEQLRDELRQARGTRASRAAEGYCTELSMPLIVRSCRHKSKMCVHRTKSMRKLEPHGRRVHCPAGAAGCVAQQLAKAQEELAATQDAKAEAERTVTTHAARVTELEQCLAESQAQAEAAVSAADDAHADSAAAELESVEEARQQAAKAGCRDVAAAGTAHAGESADQGSRARAAA